VSIIFLVFESYEMVRRQVLYMNSLNLGEEFEVIFADDGSNPPVILYDHPNFRFKRVYRERKQPWTIPKICNAGVKKADGIYVMFLGADHMLSPEWVEWARSTNAGYAVFTRKYALLNPDGHLLKIQWCEEDCNVDYTSLGWIRRNHYWKVGGMTEKFSGPTKGSADVSLFQTWCGIRGTTRANIIDRGRKKNPFYYMLPEKKSMVPIKWRKGEHWKALAHLRPMHFLHRMPDRDAKFKTAAEIPLDSAMVPKMMDRVRFVHLDGTISGLKFNNLIEWRHPAEVRYMLGEME
jgi:glycosyltransferase involved in cell wall biosynthesis